MSFSQGEGVAGVLITASASTHEIVSQAARSCRRRGRVVLVGVVGLQLNRADFYKNEISFQVACSYGTREGNVPGGAQHNFNRILAMMADQRLSVGNLVTHNYGFLESDRAYEKLSDPTALGIVLDYAPVASAEDELLQRSITLAPITAPASQGLGVIGSGNFAMRTLLPAISEIDDAPPILTVLAHQGVQAVMAAEKFGGAQATTDQDAVFAAKNVSSLLVTTRHDSHARLALRALEYGKHVWVEKPLAMSLEDLERLKTALTANALASPVLMVGFNRRFAPMATKLHAALRQQGKPIRVTMEVNAGQLPRDHWTLDPLAGGGRIVGEGCHFVDLARYLVGQPVAKVSCLRRDTDGQDGAKYALAFADGSLAEIDYRTDLPPHQAKERIELTGEGIGAKIQNWTRLEVTGLSGISGGGGLAGKGHVQALRSFFASHESGVPPVAYDELFEVSAWVIVMQKMAAGEEITAPPGGFSF
jgi:predicted dehydrogenase